MVNDTKTETIDQSNPQKDQLLLNSYTFLYKLEQRFCVIIQAFWSYPL